MANYLNAQVGINTTEPNASTVLDVVASNKGILIPRIQLTATTDVATIESPLESLLIYNTTTIGDVTPGYYYWDGTKWVRFAIEGGGGNAMWSLAGNTITDADFLGTLNNKPLYIKINNQNKTRISARGQIEPLNTNGSVFLGEGAGAATNNNGINNTFVGYQADYDASGGSNSIAIGYKAKTSSNYSITIGDQSDADSNNSISIGRSTQSQGNEGIALGRNTYVSGNSSIAFGTSAKAQTDYAIVIGNSSQAYRQNAVALGRNINVQGDNSVGMGANIYIGHSNSLVLGNNTQSTKTNQLRLGNITEVDLNGAVIANVSDGRFKKEINENVNGLDFINALRPVTYIFDSEKYNDFHKELGGMASSNIVESGFIAQEVEEVMQNTGYDFNGLIVPKNTETDNYKISYEKFVVPLVKAVQEQQEIIESLQQQINDLNKLKTELLTLQASLTQFKASSNNVSISSLD